MSNPFSKPPSDRELRRIVEQIERDGNAPMRPMDMPADLFPLMEFAAAYALAKELGMAAEMTALEEYIRGRVGQLADKALGKPKPFEPQDKPKLAG